MVPAAGAVAVEFGVPNEATCIASPIRAIVLQSCSPVVFSVMHEINAGSGLGYGP